MLKFKKIKKTTPREFRKLSHSLCKIPAPRIVYDTSLVLKDKGLSHSNKSDSARPGSTAYYRY